MAAGYDISASVSDATTQGFNKSLGPFTVGGGGKTSWLWPVVVLVVVVVLVLPKIVRAFRKPSL